ncbi:hypothetical protein QBC42DRAFT_297642 [Cladorrhinum samala]|uniref:Uncharacterized protein n=1 Tax=Cladorrhinum samala TaxID=585594 RepID=A0AAV9HQ06_9PEZI|nr:hypothetical protein QBC42DRAFT_297642 [Cladorrhinum samala]
MAGQDAATQTHEITTGEIRLGDPPPLTVTEGNKTITTASATISIGYKIGGLELQRSSNITRERLTRACARSIVTETTASQIAATVQVPGQISAGVPAGVAVAGGVEVGGGRVAGGAANDHTTVIKANAQFPDQDYVVVGIWNLKQSTPKEVILPLKTGNIFKQIRKAESRLRPWWKAILSLKTVVGFGVYECLPHQGRHVLLPVDKRTQQILTELYREYNSAASVDYDDRWRRWIIDEMNLGSREPEEGKYALRLVLGWSAPKISFWTASPVVLSLVIAFWYSYKPRDPGADEVAIVQTAWTIASYIITAAALMIAGLGAVTQLGN